MKETDGMAVLSFSDILLVGMDFLRKFKQVLVIGKFAEVMGESAIHHPNHPARPQANVKNHPQPRG